MLVRAFRLSDRVGITFIKANTWAGQQLLAHVALVTGRLWRFVAGVYAAVWASTTARSERAVAAFSARARAADPTAPLKAQVRALSAFTVVMLGALMIFVLWSTNPGNMLTGGGGSLGQLPPLATRIPPATLVPTPLPTPTAVPDPLRVGGSIAYTMRTNGVDNIYAISIGQSEPIQLTNSAADDRAPAWSPDGTKLAFTSRRDGNWELYVLDVETGRTTRLTNDLDFQGSPSWSPDGQWLAYEAYKEQNLDIYIIKVDGTEGPYRLTYDAAPDFNPAWSPGGRHIAFTSLRDGNQEIYIMSLDNPSEEAALNLTRTADLDEGFAAWSPNGLHVAYSARRDDGVEVVYAKPYNDPNAEPLVIGQGRQPTWSPNGASLVFVAEPAGQQRTYLVAGQFGNFGVASAVAEFPARIGSPHWSGVASAERLISWGGVQAAPVKLYEEDITFESENAPRYRLSPLPGVNAPEALLSDRVDASFNALRTAALNQIGFDLLGTLSEAWWRLDRQPQPGEPLESWHYAGRAFALNRNLTLGYPPTIEVVREDIGAETYWRVYVRAQVQDGQLGEPLRQRPWQFAHDLPRTRENLALYNQGGAVKDDIPPGYYIDFTQLAADYGWHRVPAEYSWQRNVNGVRFWEFVKTQNLTWAEAMLEIYARDALDPFLGPSAPQAASAGGES